MADYNPYPNDTCTGVPYGRIGVHWRFIDGAGGGDGYNTLGETPSCSTSNPNEMFSADIVIDSGDAWYTGTGQPGQGQFDLLAVATHEAGHMAGFYGPYSPASPGHFNPNESICTAPNPIQTMCPDYNGTAGRTLETHDIHTFKGVYGPQWHHNNDFDGTTDIPPYLFGSNGDIAISGDWDGGAGNTDTPGVFRPTAPPQWFLNNGFDAIAEVSCTWGSSSDIPIVGDWDGDGDDTPGLFRPSNNTWYLNNGCDTTTEHSFGWGVSTDKPVVGNWDGVNGCLPALGNCADTPGIFRTSNLTWYLNNGFDSGTDESFAWGSASYTPMAGNWDGLNGCAGNGGCADTPGLWRSDTQTWLLNNGFDNSHELSFVYGLAFDLPIKGNWDGDVDDTPGIVRGSS